MSKCDFMGLRPSGKPAPQTAVRHSRPLRAAAIAVGIGVSLSGCLGYHHPDERYSYTTTVEDRFPIKVAEGSARLDINVSGRNDRLSADDRVRVAQFAREFQTEGNGHLVVARPVGGGRDVVAAGKVARIQRVLHNSGLPGSSVNYRVYRPRPGQKHATVILTYSRYQATVRQCGDWTENLANTYANEQHPNFGCATQRNLAAMIDNPRDLVAPRTMDPADATRRDIVIDAYRKGESTGSEKSADESGKVSEQSQGE